MFIRQLNHFTNSFIYNLNVLNFSIFTQSCRKFSHFSEQYSELKSERYQWNWKAWFVAQQITFLLTPISFLERAAKAYRDTTSVVNGSVKYTWGDMHERCLKIASALNQLGISRGDVVSWFFWFCSCFIDLISAFDHCF